LADQNPTPERHPPSRKSWQRPVLVVYGTVAELTGYPDEVDQVRSGGISDRNLKEHIEPVDVQAVLARLTALPIATWNYIADDAGVRHMGPMAQDFVAAFALGADDRHIHVIDASGVTMASLQALYELVQEQARQIALLRAELGALSRQTGKDAAMASGG
jgi:hypothetical protein